jgi:hypothetical protein
MALPAPVVHLRQPTAETNPYTDWVETVIALATPALPKGFVGQIRLNCFMGNVTNANVEYSVKRR